MSPPINLDGNSVDAITMDGDSVSEVTVDGSTVFGNAIPDAVVSQYKYEDDSDTTVAVDSVGSNDANINGASYSSTAKVGSLALAHDGQDDDTQSQNSVDLSAGGDTGGFAVAAWVYFRTNEDFRGAFGHSVDDNNFLIIRSDSGNIESFYQNGSSNDIITGPSFSTNTWYHVYAEIQDNDPDYTHVLKVDETQEGSSNSGFDPANLGSGIHITGRRSTGSSLYTDVIVDDFHPCNDPLTDDELSTIVSRGT